MSNGQALGFAEKKGEKNSISMPEAAGNRPNSGEVQACFCRAGFFKGRGGNL